MRGEEEIVERKCEEPPSRDGRIRIDLHSEGSGTVWLGRAEWAAAVAKRAAGGGVQDMDRLLEEGILQMSHYVTAFEPDGTEHQV